MNKIIFAAFVAMGLIGCGDAFNSAVCRETVVKAVGSEDVVEVGSYKYVAKDVHGNIFYFEMMGSATKPTKKTLVFKGA